jgi:tRNA(adenine34) deaminase
MSVHKERDQFWLQKALELARQAEACAEVPIGAVLVLNDELLAEGYNQPIASCDPSAHAEIISLRRGAEKLSNYRLLNTTLYVTLEPCAMCVGAMLQARIKRLVFGAYDAKAGAVTSVFQLLDTQSLNHSIEYQGGVLADECSEILRKFFQKRR